MDDRGNDDPDREKTTERPSVLAELRDRAGRIPPMTHRDDEELSLIHILEAWTSFRLGVLLPVICHSAVMGENFTSMFRRR